MKRINLITSFAILIANFFTGCHKDPTVEKADPVANFTFDKDTFIAGETVHCINTSTNAYSYKWTAPDGSTYTTQNLDYTIDSNSTPYPTKLFALEVATKNGGKTDTVSKPIVVKELILQTDYFSIDNYIYKPITKALSPNSSIYYMLYASDGYGPSCYNGLLITFYTSVPPTEGTYSCQTTDPTLPDQVRIQIGAPTGIECPSPVWHISMSGQLDLSYTSNGKLRVVFNNVPATGGVLISGDITSH